MLHLLYRWRNHRHQTSLYTFSLVALLYTIADGIITFYLPILAEEVLTSMALVGIVLASSSVWDIVADVFLGFQSKEVKHKQLIRWAFVIMLISIGSNVLGLGGSLGVRQAILLLSMLLWGFYYEAMMWGVYDFVVDTREKGTLGASFGVISVFQSLGYAIGPVIAGMAILISAKTALGTGSLFAILGLLLFSMFTTTYKEPQSKTLESKLHLRAELALWKSIGRTIFPLLLMSLSVGLFNGVVFSMTPILVEAKANFHLLGGFIVGAFSIPMILFSGWFGRLVDKYGKHQFVMLASFLIATTMGVFGLVDNPWVAAVLALVAGTGLSLLYPALDSQFSGYIGEHTKQEKEALGEMGVSVNLGFILGASLGGIFVSLTGGYWVSYFIVAAVFAFSSFIYFQNEAVLKNQ
jgi:MFS family permease